MHGRAPCDHAAPAGAAAPGFHAYREGTVEKLKLNIDELRVEAFEAADPTAEPEGTVHGHWATLICSEKRSCGQVCP
jgi:hypothetical protein